MSAARVLVVDDNHMNLELVSFMLEAAQFEVAVATDAPSALAQMARVRPDLILMDIQMPGTDGLALTQQIKAQPDQADIVVVAFTAYAMKGDEARMRAAGCDGYISKPIEVGTFVQQVSACLAKGARSAR